MKPQRPCLLTIQPWRKKVFLNPAARLGFCPVIPQFVESRRLDVDPIGLEPGQYPPFIACFEV
jgi:hypothetical protein